MGVSPSALFVYRIHYDNLIYYRKRFRFFQAAAKVPVRDLLIIYDSRAMPDWDQSPYLDWAERVFFLDYHQTIRLRVDFERDAFLAQTLAELRDWAVQLGRVDWVYGYQLRYDPLVKMVIEAVTATHPGSRLAELEDGFFDYLVAEAPDRFQLKDSYAGSRFGETPYRHFFSLDPPRVPRERFYYALFHPELIDRVFSQQVHVAELFDFPAAVQADVAFEKTVVTSPNLRGDLNLFIDFNERVTRLACDTYWAALHPFSFWYREASLLPLVFTARRAGCVGLVGDDAWIDRLTALLAEHTPEVAVIAGAEPSAVKLCLKQASSELDLADDAGTPVYTVTDDDLRFIAETRDCSNSSRRMLPLLADEPFDRYRTKKPMVTFSSLVPFELMRIRQSVVVSASSSLSYRIRHIQPDNDSYVVVPTYQTEHPRWNSTRVVPAAEWDVWARVFTKMGVGVYRNDVGGTIMKQADYVAPKG